MDSLAITDHGAMYGVIDFYVAAKDAGIKPIIGCEVYVAATSRHSREPAHKDPFHITLLAKNEKGYHNLIQLVSKSHLEGFYYKPRVDKELLALHHDGLIALSGCAHGELPRLILANELDKATQTASWYKEVFGDYYLEIQRHPIPELEKINEGLISLSAKLGIPPVATFDVHYVNKEDAAVHELLLCMQTNTSIHDEKRLKMAGDFFYLRSPEEAEELFSDLPQAIENTQHIADMCQLEIDFTKLHLPQVELPQGKTADSLLAELCWQGLEKRYPEPGSEVKERLSYELEVIKKTNFANYFLVVWDIVSFAKKQGIYFGVRGSAAASLALYCLGITDIDPLSHRLVFERFLNVERLELPDIDLDFQDDRRDEIIAYINQKYGSDHVAQIITFGTLGARAALRDTGRALGMPYSQVDRIARLLPLEPSMTLDRALQESNELHNVYYQDEEARNLIDTAKKLEGISRHASTHAAGVVISPDPLTEHLPLQAISRGNQQAVMTQFTMENVARLGLLKLDVLGLANLTILSKTVELIKQNQGVSLDLQHIPLDDTRTFQLLASGESRGVFQLESTGMRRYLKELAPTNFNDVAAMVALYRPGPMEQIPTFIKAKQGTIPVRYPHPALKEILEETYGIIVYQEQVLLIAQALAGYSLGQADIFRKAMGKKIPAVMKKEEKNFIAKASKQGIPKELAKEVFSLIEPFAGYAFNKAHSVSYALIAYSTAYLKANYTIEYVTAFLNTYSDNMERVRLAIAESQRLGIAVLPPDINKSQSAFTIEKDEKNGSAIRFGLATIKNVGAAPIDAILSARSQDGIFKSIEDFCYRVNLHNINKKVLESLIKAGAFDPLGSRGKLLKSIDRIISLAQMGQRMRETGQTSLFDLCAQSPPAFVLTPEAGEDEDVSPKQKFDWERELLGVCFSQYPLDFMNSKLSSLITASCGEISADMANETVVTAGMVATVRQLYTRNQRPFITALLEDLDGSTEVIVWPEVYNRTRELWQEGNILLVKGLVKLREDRIQLSCYEAKPFQQSDVEEKEQSTEIRWHLIIGIKQTDDTEKDIECLRHVIDILQSYPGQNRVSLNVSSEGKTTKLELPKLTITYCPELASQLTSILGEDNVRLQQEFI